jgi:trk system potassium uptake protein TrkA
MRVIVVGAGKVGTFIAADLLANGHEVIIVEQNAARHGRLQQHTDLDGVQWVVADACEVSQLALAQPELADAFVAVTGDDEDNLVASLLAKQEFAVPKVLARVNHPANEWLFNDDWGVDIAVSTPHLLSGLVEEAVSVGSVVRLLQLSSTARLVEVTLRDDAPVVGIEIADARLPRDSSVVAVLRAGSVVVPRGDTTFLVGDEVLVLVTDESEPRVRQLLTAPSSSV